MYNIHIEVRELYHFTITNSVIVVIIKTHSQLTNEVQYER